MFNLVSDTSRETDLTIGFVVLDPEAVTEVNLVTGAAVILETTAEAETVRTYQRQRP